MTLLAFIGVAAALGVVGAYVSYLDTDSVVFSYIGRASAVALLVTLFYGACESDSFLESVGFVVVASYVHEAVERNWYKFLCSNFGDDAAVAA